ncbi:hypothetical protein CKM354_000085300 [Cercospora kikuchii]|uniref:Heterokaryon incompatibility domain-containing protein n=1 Tax=Cercospora kikuchii TaxID=84275 RepID=A0A9P3C656_9PEZI|nr:uncharacterized protein CKM354_000085300 [Cercospora kikuchii]GIZ37407.1 hypothetical protein CKM354_000085300 [Cercospora kikuchii]
MEASGFTAAVPLDTEHLTSILSAEPRLDQANLPPVAVDQRIYTPLQDARSQIRLLKWRADSDPAGVHDLQTSVWDLDTAPAYIAISYTWGPTVNRPIVIDGISTSVRHNAYYALWQIRQLQPHCFVWIDSICINQQDDEEKSAQVAIIFQIFQEAVRVVACLGEHADDSHFLYATAKMLVPHFRESWERYGTQLEGLFFGSYEQNTTLWKLDAPTFQRLISACTRFFCRPYWSRLWIVQELAAAHHEVLFACGVHTLGSKMFYILYVTLFEATTKKHEAWKLRCNPSNIDVPATPSNMRPILFRAYSGTVATSLNSLGQLLAASMSMLCADVRDRLFGTLAMTDWTLTGCAPITPDYTKSACELAIMLARRLNIRDLQTGLLALEIDCHHEEIRTAVQNQRDQPFTPEFEDVDESCIEEFTISAKCAPLYYSEDGFLAADLCRLSPYDVTKTLKACTECAAYKAREGVLRGHGQKELDVDGTLAALLCADATSGDIIIHCSGFLSAISSFDAGSAHPTRSGWSTVVLVVRQQNDDRFDIVGQGILTNDFNVYLEDDWKYKRGLDYAGACHAREHSRFGAHVSLRLTPEELILLIAQDLQRIEGQPNYYYSMDTYNADDRLQRLVTPPSARPRDAVRFCSTSCCPRIRQGRRSDMPTIPPHS